MRPGAWVTWRGSALSVWIRVSEQLGQEAPATDELQPRVSEAWYDVRLQGMVHITVVL